MNTCGNCNTRPADPESGFCEKCWQMLTEFDIVDTSDEEDELYDDLIHEGIIRHDE